MVTNSIKIRGAGGSAGRRLRSRIRLCALLPWVVTVASEPARADESQFVQQRLDAAAVALRMGQPRDALGALKQARDVEPDNPWIAFFFGEAHQQLGEPYRALDEYDRALKILDDLDHPDDDLERTVQKRRQTARRQVFSVDVQMGLAYDTNVTFLGGGASDLDLIANVPDGLFSSGASASWSPIADRDQVLTFGLRTSQSWHFRIDSFDLQDYGFTVRYLRRLTDRWRIEGRYDYDMLVLGTESYLSNHVLSAALQYVWRPTDARVRLLATSLGYRFEGRDFLFPTSDTFDQDGVVNAVNVRQTLSVQPLANVSWKWDIGLGYEFASVATEGTEFDRLTHDFGVDLSIPLINPAEPDKYLILPDKELLFQFAANWQIGNFREESEIDRRERHRRDLITTLVFAVSQKLIEDPRTGDLTLSGVVQWTNTDSNVITQDRAAPFTYDKIVYGLQLAWSF